SILVMHYRSLIHLQVFQRSSSSLLLGVPIMGLLPLPLFRRPSLIHPQLWIPFLSWRMFCCLHITWTSFL
ncbi:hypothetical protein KI387_026690, partial [Taxus chinensis]